MQIAMWTAGGLGILLIILIARRQFICGYCRGDGFISETQAIAQGAATPGLPVLEDQACPFCNGKGLMKYKRCPRCVGRGQIHKANKTARCPVCRGSGRVKFTAGEWIGASFRAIGVFVMLAACGVICGLLIWGIWDLLQQFAIQAGMAA